MLARRFGEPPLQLDDERRAAMLETLAGAGVLGGASYDGIVGLEADAHGRTLVTLDRRAETTYQRLGVACRLLP